jgi:Flp pilus assembly secretin CpaC
MRPLHTAIALLIAVSTPLPVLAAPLQVPLNQVRKLPFSGLASTVTPGNSDIADVFVVDDHTILVQGKKPGVTNLVVLDRAGRTLYNDRVVVSTANADVNAVMISRGSKVTAYACEPFCVDLRELTNTVPQPGGLGGR